MSGQERDMVAGPVTPGQVYLLGQGKQLRKHYCTGMTGLRYLNSDWVSKPHWGEQ